MTSFGVGMGGNLLASLAWHYIEPLLSDKEAAATAERVARAAFRAEVERLCATASADPDHVMAVLDHALPADALELLASYAAGFDTASEISPTTDDILNGLVERLESAGLDSATLPIDLGELLKAAPAAIRQCLLEAAMKPASPLYNRISLTQLTHIRETMDTLRARLDLPARPSEPVSLPVPPRPYFPHTFATQRNLGPRTADRRKLTRWWMTADEPVLILVAMGGMGKTSLIWTWILTDVLGLQSKTQNAHTPLNSSQLPAAYLPDGVMWWSFQESDGSFAQFLDAALAYVEGHGAKHQRSLTDAEKVTGLLTSLRARRFLLVLDGLEAELAAHAGTSGLDEGIASTDPTTSDFRRCVNPLLAKFLRDLQSVPGSSRLLVTSSLFPSDLQDLAGTRREDVGPLSRDEAIRFLRAQGVEGTPGALGSVCDDYGSHPLALRILSGIALQDRRTPGAVGAIRRSTTGLAVCDAVENALGLASASLSSPARDLLGRLGAFRFSVPYETALAINPCASTHAFDRLLDDLVARELVTVREGIYTIHPVVRRYAYSLLSADSRKTTHLRAAELFAADASSLPRRVKSLDEAVPALEYYYHLIGAEDWRGAVDVLHTALRPQLYYALGAYSAYTDAVSQLVDPETLAVHGDLSDSYKAIVLNLLGNALCAMGRAVDAVPVFTRALETEPDDSVNYPVDTGNLGARCLLPLGQLRAAETRLVDRIRSSQRVVRHLTTAATERRDHLIAFTRNNEAIGRSDLAYLYGLCGRYEESRSEFERAFGIFDDEQSRGIVKRLQGEVALLRDDLAEAQDCASAATAFTAKDHLARDVIHLGCLLGAVDITVAEHDPADHRARAERLRSAESHLNQALQQCRESNLIEAEPKILIAAGNLHRVAGALEAAERRFEEALDLANTCHYRLSAADAEYGLAKLALDSNARPKALKHAREALSLARCDSTPYEYAAMIERAERLLITIE